MGSFHQRRTRDGVAQGGGLLRAAREEAQVRCAGAFKLLEMHEVPRRQGKRAGPRVAPERVVAGGVASDAAGRVRAGRGPAGDLPENMRHVDATRVRVVRRDVFELDELEIRAMRRDAGRPGDVFGTVLSDLAPRTTGSKATDAARSYALAAIAPPRSGRRRLRCCRTRPMKTRASTDCVEARVAASAADSGSAQSRREHRGETAGRTRRRTTRLERGV